MKSNKLKRFIQKPFARGSAPLFFAQPYIFLTNIYVYIDLAAFLGWHKKH